MPRNLVAPVNKPEYLFVISVCLITHPVYKHRLISYASEETGHIQAFKWLPDFQGALYKSYQFPSLTLKNPLGSVAVSTLI